MFAVLAVVGLGAAANHFQNQHIAHKKLRQLTDMYNAQEIARVQNEQALIAKANADTVAALQQQAAEKKKREEEKEERKRSFEQALKTVKSYPAQQKEREEQHFKQKNSFVENMKLIKDAILACVTGEIEYIEDVLNMGEDVHRCFITFELLPIAVEHNQLEVITLLFKSGYKVQINNVGIIEFAYQKENREAVKLLLDYYQRSDMFLKLIENGSIDEIREQLILGASVNTENEEGYNALQLAIRYKRATSILDFLIRSGIDLEHKKNREGKNVLEIAQSGNCEPGVLGFISKIFNERTIGDKNNQNLDFLNETNWSKNIGIELIPSEISPLTVKTAYKEPRPLLDTTAASYNYSSFNIKGWGALQHNSIFKAELLNTSQGQKIFLLVLSNSGVHLNCFNPVSNHWEALPNGPSWTVNDGWSNARYYKTICSEVLPGSNNCDKLLLLARASDGIHLHCYDTATNQWQIETKGPDWKDEDGWDAPQYYTSICTEIMCSKDGQKKLFLFARGKAGISLHSYDVVTKRWEAHASPQIVEPRNLNASKASHIQVVESGGVTVKSNSNTNSVQLSATGIPLDPKTSADFKSSLDSKMLERMKDPMSSSTLKNLTDLKNTKESQDNSVSNKNLSVFRFSNTQVAKPGDIFGGEIRILPTLETVGQGDCAFHAIFGKWSHEKQKIFCADVVEKRKKMADAIKNLEQKSDIFKLVVDSIQVMLDSGSNCFKKLKEELKTYKISDEKLSNEAWGKLENALKTCKKTSEYIANGVKSKKGLSDFKAQFHHCLNINEGMLYALIHSMDSIRPLFVEYNNSKNAEFDLAKRILNDKSILTEYADYIQRSGQYLLPSELSIIAHIFNINVIYRTYNKNKKTFSNPESFNPNGTSSVGVCFNGSNHFERMNVEHFSKQNGDNIHDAQASCEVNKSKDGSTAKSDNNTNSVQLSATGVPLIPITSTDFKTSLDTKKMERMNESMSSDILKNLTKDSKENREKNASKWDFRPYYNSIRTIAFRSKNGNEQLLLLECDSAGLKANCYDPVHNVWVPIPRFSDTHLNSSKNEIDLSSFFRIDHTFIHVLLEKDDPFFTVIKQYNKGYDSGQVLFSDHLCALGSLYCRFTDFKKQTDTTFYPYKISQKRLCNFHIKEVGPKAIERFGSKSIAKQDSSQYRPSERRECVEKIKSCQLLRGNIEHYEAYLNHYLSQFRDVEKQFPNVRAEISSMIPSLEKKRQEDIKTLEEGIKACSQLEHQINTNYTKYINEINTARANRLNEINTHLADLRHKSKRFMGQVGFKTNTQNPLNITFNDTRGNITIPIMPKMPTPAMATMPTLQQSSAISARPLALSYRPYAKPMPIAAGAPKPAASAAPSVALSSTAPLVVSRTIISSNLTMGNIVPKADDQAKSNVSNTSRL